MHLILTLRLHLSTHEEQTDPTSSISNAVAFTNGQTNAANNSVNVIKVNPSINFAQRPLPVKLSYVARDVPNLPDAIFALSEWTIKAASRGEVVRYLLEMAPGGAVVSALSDTTVNEIGPLRTIIQRVLLHSNNPKQDQTIISGCANWITSILLGPACHLQPTVHNHNNKVAHSTTMKKAVAELLRRGRACLSQLISITTSECPTAEEFSRFVSTSILELLQRAATQKHLYEKRPLSHSDSGNDSRKQCSIAFSSHSQAQLLVKEAESDIAALAAKLASNKMQLNIMPSSQPSSRRTSKNKVSAAASSVLVDLMNRRDRSKQIADKSGMVVEISVDCKKKFGNNENEEEGKDGETRTQDRGKTNGQVERNAQLKTIAGQYQTTDDKNTLVLKCLGSTLHSTVATSVSEATALETEIEGLINQSSSVKDDLTTRQATIITKRKEIASRMEQLRRELDELSRQDEQLATEEEGVFVELDKLARRTDRDISGLKSEIEGRAIYVTLDKELRRAMDKLGELEMAWIRSTSNSGTSATSPTGGESTLFTITGKFAPSSHSVEQQPEPPLPTLLRSKLTSYLNRARSYFQSEAACVEFLRNRVSSAEAEVLDLEREIQVFSNLGMKNNVEKMTNRLMTLKNHVEEDTVVINALRKDAKEMRGDLIRRVDEYYVVMEKRDGDEKDAGGNENNNEILNPEHVAALEGISIDLTGIGFYDDEDGGLGGIFSRIPKRVSRVVSPVVSSENDCDRSTSFIGDIDMLPEMINDTEPVSTKALAVVATHVEKVAMPKFSWANNSNGLPRTEAKSLLEIQMEEMSAKKNNGSA